MYENVLITGGAGFIGSNLTDVLIALGHRVTILDTLHPQVHGPNQQVPDYFNQQAKLVRGDVRNADLLQETLAEQTIVFHFAAYTGVGQSMYQIQEYLDVNVQGTAVLLELLSQKKHQVRKLILASSRAIYGEGAYECTQCGPVYPKPRSLTQLREGQWEVVCPLCGSSLTAIPTPEEKPADPYSIYAISKQNQEQICQLIGETYHLPTVVLRYFNVYGPRQSMQNPYTGVINTFITRLLNGKAPEVYEDGLESRDFVHVQDVVQACVLAMTKETADGRIFNVGSGKQASLLQAAEILAALLDGPAPIVTGQFRAGDIRHCYADIRRAETFLGYHPQITFKKGLTDLLAAMVGQQWEDLSQVPLQELKERGLTS